MTTALTTVTVTHEWYDGDEFDSGSVEYLGYDSATKTLFVVWQDAERVYRFDNVPLFDVENAARSWSVGRAVNELKNRFGPSRFVGSLANVRFEKVAPVTSFPVPNDGAPAQTKEFSLTEVPVKSGQPGLSVASDTHTYELFFDLDGTERSHTITGKATLDSALESLNDAAEALGVPIEVKKAVVTFV